MVEILCGLQVMMRAEPRRSLCSVAGFEHAFNRSAAARVGDLLIHKICVVRYVHPYFRRRSVDRYFQGALRTPAAGTKMTAAVPTPAAVTA